MNTKALRSSLYRSGKYYRKGFGYTDVAAERMNLDYQSSLIQAIRENNNTLKQGNITVRLAETFGFCWGVERAISLAYETRRQFPDSKIWITNEIIHNPLVNRKLQELSIEFIPINRKGEKDFTCAKAEDVMILPAFGVSIEEMQMLSQKGCVIVDTTCPWVSRVWNSVEKHKKKAYTSIIHGKYAHEETIATSSYADKYLIVLNIQEARYVCDYILNGGNRIEFLAKFQQSCSLNFDPDTDLCQIGIANQTTMLKGETEQIGKLFEHTLMRKYGITELDQHFLSFNTICDATQERQDAVADLISQELDLVVVVGGFNSSNTTHLQEIASQRQIPAYHIDSAERIGPGNRIQHKSLYKGLETVEDWLPAGPVVVGVTSGASTPDRVVADIIEQIFEVQFFSATLGKM
ncbi:MAG: 4-hydroxy-3-methylbut-2-enyl diphosphate reductase [Cyanobacteria bacterium P01_A01_bin.15]